jgi:hypothetical protein
MTKYLVLYTFHRADTVSLHRLISLRKNNPDVTIVPCFGFSQNIYFPKIIRPNEHIFSPVLPEFIRSLYFSNLTKFEKEKTESFRRRNEISKLKALLTKLGLTLHCDFTSFGKHNQDLAIINWFSTKGKFEDFDVAVYLEYDVITTKPISNLYHAYQEYDAGFCSYSLAPTYWYWYSHPKGALESIQRWLRERNRPPLPYWGFFPGNFLSRRVLQQLSEQRLPTKAFCELRLPTIISGLGFSVTRLKFPKIRLRPAYTKAEIIAAQEFGIFHPFYDDLNLNFLVEDKQRFVA